MTAVVVLSPSGMATGRRIADALGAPLHARAGGADLRYAEPGPHLAGLFAAGTPIVFVGALGILVRVLAPGLADKRTEPPVLCVAEDGSAVIPVLGGHRGANALARAVAGLFGTAAAVTTATDVGFGVALDDPPAGWSLAPGQDYKGFAARLLAGAAVRVEGGAPWLERSGLPAAAGAPLAIRVTEGRVEPAPGVLAYHPHTLALGVGCERGTDPAELAGLVRTALTEAGLASEAVACVVSLDLKEDEPAVQALAAGLGRPARFPDAAALEAETPRLANPSEVVFREVGAHGVAEAAALAAAGPGGRLVVEKRKSARATCAVARAPAPIDPGTVGRPRGRLLLVGLGPGQPGWRTPEATDFLAEATDIVGYRLYLDQLGPLAAGRRLHGFALGEEAARCRAALDLAAEGRTVALVSSGDIGVYAMASLVFELVEQEARPDWRRLDIRTAPGISALQACAARVGAPLGHDFCAISLSDLMTPWETIRARVAAAAAGDFVVAFYNPVSARRRHQLAEAREILLAHRPADTPVVLGRELGRPDERLTVTTLGALTVGQVDMLTLVLVGSSRTRRDGDRVYTPRGYASKRETGRAAE